MLLLATIMLPYTVNREVFNVLTGFLWWSHKGWHKLPVSRSWGGLLSPPPPPSMSCQSAGWLEGRWYPSSSKNLAISCLQCQLNHAFDTQSHSSPGVLAQWLGCENTQAWILILQNHQRVSKTYPSQLRAIDTHPWIGQWLVCIHACRC